MSAVEGSILPLEVLQKIFSYLEVQQIEASVAPVCRLWFDASRLPVVRRRLTLTDKISPSAAHEMLRSSPELTELKMIYISTASYNDGLLRTAAAHNVKLRVLGIVGYMSDIGLEAVAQCSELRTLSLSTDYYEEPYDFTDDGVVHLARLRHLEKLHLDGRNSVTPAGWRRLFSLCQWPHLRDLSLCLCEEDEDEYEEPQVYFERLPTSLRSLELSGFVSDVELMAVAQCSQLRSLSLRDYYHFDCDISGDGVVHLARLRHLGKLQLRCSKVTRAGWRRLFSVCEWPHLRELSLWLEARDEPRLQLERLRTTLRSIELHGDVSDMDLEAVAQCDQLNTLSLDLSNRFTDDGFMHLARLRHLDKLVLWNSYGATAARWRRLLSVCEWPHLRQLNLMNLYGLGEGEREDLRRQAGLLCPIVTIR